MKILMILALTALSLSAYSQCELSNVCDEYNNCTVQNICDSSLDIPAIGIPPIRTLGIPGIKPIQPLRIPPIGTRRCEQMVVNGVWQSVCY